MTERVGRAQAVGGGLRLSGRSHPRVLVVHPKLLVAQVLARRLAQEPDVEVSVGTTQATLSRLGLDADVVVLDQRMRAADGSVLLSELLGRPDPPVVVVLGGPGDDPVAALLQGARGWVPTEGSTDDLATAVRAVAEGQVWLPPDCYAQVVERLVQTRRRQGELDVLTPRQLQVLQALVNGDSVARIAANLYMSENTVRTHCNRLYRRLGVHSALEAVALAREAGFFPR